MHRYVYKTVKFNGHEITAAGSIYKRGPKGDLRKVHGPAAQEIKRQYIQHLNKGQS